VEGGVRRAVCKRQEAPLENCFVLLDDCHATQSNPSSRLYTGYVKQYFCTDPATLDAFWAAVEADQAQGLHAAVLVDYEWGAKLQRAGTRCLAANDAGALRVLLFSQCAHLPSAAVDRWLADQDGCPAPSCAGVADWVPSVTQTEFEAGVAKILDLIRAGETYQVNYTYRMHGAQYGSPFGLYRRLRSLQPVAFGALVAMPKVPGAADSGPHWVLSCSPELFVRNTQGHLSTRPMKGTAARATTAPADAQRSHWLGTDPKNRAENVMIVDLLRNDLGRISTTGSVRVPRLFTVETYATVHQMTSTVESELRPGLRFPDVLRALFPCGSITGTPKIHTMDWIAALESTPRGLYCGAIGWVDTPTAGAHCGDFCLSVAIRTLTLGGPQDDGKRRANLGVGGGIVLDSDRRSEFEETRVKARFLTQIDPGFTLFETLLLHKGRLRNLALHQARMAASARALGFHFAPAEFVQQLAVHIGMLNSHTDYRIRLDLAHDGSLRIAHSVLDPLPNGPVRLVWAQHPVEPAERALLQHKTSLRSSYDRAIADASTQGAFDAVFVNAAGEVTEGARTSMFIKLDGCWWTAPLASGVLPGVMRQRVLRRFPTVGQKALGVADVARAERIVVCNALRGLLRAHPLALPESPARLASQA
jgi:para-aminobenzoate synthetase/4-amino-4-deoxychorismate lyase